MKELEKCPGKVQQTTKGFLFGLAGRWGHCEEDWYLAVVPDILKKERTLKSTM